MAERIFNFENFFLVKIIFKLTETSHKLVSILLSVLVVKIILLT